MADQSAGRSLLSKQSREFSFWYPTWDAWKFQRTLTYWISVMYLEGSILFIAGAAFSFSGIGDWGNGMEYAVVVTPYFAGGICFTLGSYFGLLEVANMANNGRIHLCCFFCGAEWRRLRKYVGWQAAAGYTSYLVGALFFNIDTLASYCEMPDLQVELFVWVPATLGAAGFVIGGAIECQANQVWKFHISSGAWWLSVCNFFGAILFLVAGIAGDLHAKGMIERFLVDFTYLVGSASFAVGAMFTLWMWKTEQFGLGLIPEMSEHERRPDPEADVLSMHEEYGCGRASPLQMPFIVMYLLNATASILLVGLAIWPQKEIVDREYDLFEASLNAALSHGIALLASVVHHVPTAQPHKCLLVYMRVVFVLYTINSWIRVKHQIAG